MSSHARMVRDDSESLIQPREIIASAFFGVAYMLTPCFAKVSEDFAIDYSRLLIGGGAFFLCLLICKLALRGASDALVNATELRCSNSIFAIAFSAFFFGVGLLWVIVFYPGVGMTDSILIVEKGLVMSAQHPWFYCLVIQLMRDAVIALGGGLEAVFLVESLVQVIVADAVITYCLVWLKRHRISGLILVLVSAFYALCPILCLYNISLFKDVPYSYTLMLWAIVLFECWESRGRSLKSGRTWVVVGALIVLSLLRSNGLIISAFILIGLLFAYRNYWRVISCFIVVLVCVAVGGHLFESANGITHLFKETVGIPLQQIAATVSKDGNISADQEKFVNDVMPIDDIRERYDPYTADKLKWRDSTIDNRFLNTHKLEFLRVYFEIGLANPGIYAEAYLRATFGFWSTDDNARGRFSTLRVDGYDSFFSENDINVKSLLPESVQSVLEEKLLFPMTGSKWGEGHLFWTFVFMCLLLVSVADWRSAIVALPGFGCWLTLMMSTPVAYQFRYVLVFPLTIPLIVCFISLVMKRGDAKERLEEKRVLSPHSKSTEECG